MDDVIGGDLGKWSPELNQEDMKVPEPKAGNGARAVDDTADAERWASIPEDVRALTEASAREVARAKPPSVSGEHGHNAAFALVVGMRRLGIPPALARAIFVEEFNPRCSPPWSDREIDHKFAEASRVEKLGDPMRYRKVREKLAGDVDAKNTSAPSTPRRILLGDQARLARFVKDHRARLRHVQDRNAWVEWDGYRWAQAQKSNVLNAAKETCNTLAHEAATSGDEGAFKRAHEHTKSVRSIADMAMGERELWCQQGDFDQDPDVLNVLNGVVDLRTGELRERTREMLLTKLTRIEYDPNARAPRWEQFLDEVFQGKRDLIEFVHTAMGYSLTAHTKEQVFFVLWGDGRNGKSRFVRQLTALLNDASCTANIATLATAHHGGEQNTPGLADMMGSRVVVTTEPDENFKISEGLIKDLTGESKMKVCRKYENPVVMKPQFKIWIPTNHRPRIDGIDPAIWRRPKLVPFRAKFEGASADKDLDAKLDAERAGILAWAVRGAMRWYKSGLADCEDVRAEVEQYREESDVLKPFLEECLEPAPDAFASSDEVYQAYRTWCARNGYDRPMSKIVLGRKLVARGFKAKKKERGNGYLDIRVRTFRHI